MLNIGDVIFQLIMVITIGGLIGAVIFLIRSLFFPKQPNKEVEKKLDRIIELLERQHKE